MPPIEVRWLLALVYFCTHISEGLKRKTCGFLSASVTAHLPHPLRLEVAQVRDGGVDRVHHKHPRLFFFFTRQKNATEGVERATNRGQLMCKPIMCTGYGVGLALTPNGWFLEAPSKAHAIAAPEPSI